MPRKEEVTYYKFDELSKKAKERAIQDWRDKGHDFDDHDAKFLSDDFKEFLKEHGFDDDVKVSWSLGHCQGDGVCFEGRLETERFLDQEGFRKYKELAPYIYIKIKNGNHNYCHWNSMDIEMELDVQSPEYLLSDDLKSEFDEIHFENNRRTRRHQEDVYNWQQARMAPIRAWEELVKRMPRGPMEWRPDLEKPVPLDIQKPEEPELLPFPENVERALVAAKRKLERFELKFKDLEEDVKEWVKDTSRELEKIGYDEIEYRGSDEAISETLIANEYEFDEDGERI